MTYWKEKVTIGNRLYPRFFGGPLDGYTDSPFRQLVRDFSAENLLYTEIRHVGTLAHTRAAFSALRFSQIERPLQFQIATNSIRYITQAVERIQEIGVDGIDLNIACPAKNVVRSCSGSALMGNLLLLEQVLKLLRSLITGPLTVKMRAGFKEKNAQEVVRLIEACGVDALAIHPRLQTQRFSGELDYTLVQSIKNSVMIPVLYSGGIQTFADAQMVYEKTGVDGFLIGRALCGAPWKLAEFEAHACGKTYIVTSGRRAQVALKHLSLLIDYYGPRGLYHFRKHIPWYITGSEGAVMLRKRLVVAQSVAQVEQGLKEFFGV